MTDLRTRIQIFAEDHLTPVLNRMRNSVGQWADGVRDDLDKLPVSQIADFFEAINTIDDEAVLEGGIDFDVDDAKRQIGEWNNEIDSARGEIDKFNLRIADLDKQINKKRKVEVDVQEQITALERKDASEGLGRGEPQKLEALRKQLKDEQDKLKKDQTLLRLEKSKSTAEAEVKKLEKGIDEVTSKIDDFDQKITNKRTLNVALNDQATDKLIRLRSRIDDYSRQVFSAEAPTSAAKRPIIAPTSLAHNLR